MSIIADRIKNSDGISPTFDTMSATTGNINTVNADAITTVGIRSADFAVGADGVYVHISATPVADYNIVVPALPPTGTKYFGYNGASYDWIEPSDALNIPTTGVNYVVGTTGVGFTTFSPAELLTITGAQPANINLTALSNPALANAVVIGGNGLSVSAKSAETLLADIGMAPDDTPTFMGIRTASITPTTTRLAVNAEITATAGTLPNSVVVKSQLDAASGGFRQKTACRVYAGALIGTYTNPTLTAPGLGALVIDGITLAMTDRVVVDTSTSSAGIYVVTDTGSPTTPWILTRATDADIATDLVNARVFVNEGAVYASSSWVCTSVTSFAAPILFVQDGLSAQLVGINGVVVTANIAELAEIGTAGTLENPTDIIVNAYGQITAATSRTPAETRADLDLVAPTFTSAIIGGITIKTNTIPTTPYDIPLPVVAPLAGQTLVYSGTEFEWGASGAGVSGVRSVIIADYTTASNVVGGIATAGAWTQYPLNTLSLDTADVASIATNTLTVPAGIYDVTASAAFTQVGACQIRVYNDTLATVALTGTTAYSSNGSITLDDGAIVHAHINGRITLMTTTDLRVEYFVAVSSAADYELGQPSVNTNVYGQLKLYNDASIATGISTDLSLSGTLRTAMFAGGIDTVTVTGLVTALVGGARTYYLGGTPTGQFTIVPPTPVDDGTEIVIINSTNEIGKMSTVYAATYPIPTLNKQIFTYSSVLGGWI